MVREFKYTENKITPVDYIDVDEKICASCGEIIKKKAEICPRCGVRQTRRADKRVLLLLTLFFGGFGAHKFYTRKYTRSGPRRNRI